MLLNRFTILNVYLLIVGSKLVCPLVDALQGLLMQLGCHICWARQRPGGLCAHCMLQKLGQVLRGEVPEEVAALEQLVADLHGMVADLPRSSHIVRVCSPTGFGLCVKCKVR